MPYTDSAAQFSENRAQWKVVYIAIGSAWECACESGCNGHSTLAALLNTLPDTFLSIVPLVQPLICISYAQAIHMYLYMCSCSSM